MLPQQNVTGLYQQFNLRIPIKKITSDFRNLIEHLKLSLHIPVHFVLLDQSSNPTDFPLLNCKGYVSSVTFSSAKPM